MTTNPSLIVYTLEFCPHCDLLKAYLKEKGAPYSEEDMSSAESLTELRVNGVFVNEAPVLRKGDSFLTTYDLFSQGKVNTKAVDDLLLGD